MEIYILPEMTTAGTEALVESRARGLDDAEQAIAVFMAMQAVWMMAVMPQGENVH